MTTDLFEDMSWTEHTAEFLRTQGAPYDEGITAEFLNEFHAIRPAPVGAEYRPGVVYGRGGGRDLRALVYARADPSERRPGLVVMHGGGWRGGTPVAQRRQAAGFAERGIVAASIQYRFAPDWRWPSALEDAKCAVRWMRECHAELGVDPDRIAVAGGSAGAHLAAMVALTPGSFEGTGGHHEVSSDVSAVALWSPATDLRMPGAMPGIEIVVKDFLGDLSDELIREASPITYVSDRCPPVLTIAGDADQATPLAMIEDFHRALDDADVTNELIVMPGRMHAFGLHGADWQATLDRTAEWIERFL